MDTQSTFDLAGLIGAIESGNTQYQLALYADCAEMRIIDSDRPAQAPYILRGRPAIAAWIGRVYASHENHRVVDFTADSQNLALIEEYRGPEGTSVRYARSVELSGGQITSETAVLTRAEPRPASRTSMMIDQDPGSSTRSPPHQRRRATATTGDHVPGLYLG
jgi:hypothetical protein